MNYLREAEKYLEYYRDLHNSLDTMRTELSRLIEKSGPSGINNMAVIPDRIQVSGGSGGLDMYDDTVNLIFRIQTLQLSITETQEKLTEIDNLLEEISQNDECEFYGAVLRKWYIERVPKEKIASQIGYQSRTSIYTIKRRAIRKFAVRILGIKALEGI